jgi:hypothetical protein
MAGFFAQEGVSPWVLVRVVRRWPDFIFGHRNGMYSFVEAKAFTGSASGKTGLESRVLTPLIAEGAMHAAQQLSCDAFGTVWYSITRVRDIVPISLEVTFIELNVPQSRRQAQEKRPVPAAVIDGLAERAVNQAAARLNLRNLQDLQVEARRDRSGIVSNLRELADKEAADLLFEMELGSGAPPTEQMAQAVGRLLAKVNKRRTRAKELDDPSERRFMAAKERAAASYLSPLRRIGDQFIYLADLPREAVSRVKEEWTQNWKRANQPWGVVGTSDLWRCGGAVISISSENLEGTDVCAAKKSPGISPLSARR